MSIATEAPANPQLALLRTATDGTAAILAEVAERHWAAPTPCADWTVADVADHLAGSLLGLRVAFGGADPAGPDVPCGPSGDGAGASDRSTAYAAAVTDLWAAVERRGALDRVVTVPFGTVPATVALNLATVEVLVHGWDIATATGLSPTFDQPTVQAALEFSRQAVASIPPERSPFAPPRPVRSNASPIDQLVALLGRDPAYRPATTYRP